MHKSVREVRFERGSGVAATTAPQRERSSRESGKGKQGEEEDDK